MNGCGSFRLGYVGVRFEGYVGVGFEGYVGVGFEGYVVVGFGRSCDCRYGILYVPVLGGGVVFASLVILA